jgi:uncharacterized small protein (DUF1192 family)
MHHARTKSVCIRVSLEERQILRQACERDGVRSISELAREAMHRLVEARGFAPLTGRDMQFWLQELACRLASLQSEVERLQTMLTDETKH